MSNRITAYFKGRIGVAESVYQNDSGLIMVFDSIDLPAHFDCYFSRLNQEESFPGVGADNMVAIPNDILANPGNITVHIPFHTGANDSEVEYIVYFKIIGRARPVDDGTPAQMTAIEQALALLQNPIGNIEQIVNEALAFTGETFEEMQEDLDEWKTDTEEGLDTWKDGIEGDFDSLAAEVRAEVGTPLVASTAAGMTDHDKIYVYVGSETGYTSGNWYYWNGSAWTSGGVYNSTAFVTDTTLALSGKAADAKVTGDKITDVKSEINNNSQSKDYTIVSGEIIEAGFWNGSGEKQSHSSRWRTKVKLFVAKGDVVVFKRKSGLSGNSALEVKVTYFDSTGAFSSDGTLTGIGTLASSFIEITQDGFITISFYPASTSGITANSFNGIVSIAHNSPTTADDISNYGRFKNAPYDTPIDKQIFNDGYWNLNGAPTWNSSYVKNAIKYIMKKGDEIHVAKKGVTFNVVSNGVARGVTDMPFRYTNDEELLMVIPKDSNEIDFTSVDKAFYFKKSSDEPFENFTASMFTQGYVDTSNVIHAHSQRATNFDAMYARKGDIIRVNYGWIAIYVLEFSTAGSIIRTSGAWIVPFPDGDSNNHNGNYIVQSDACYVKLNIYDINAGSDSFDVSRLEDAITIIRAKDVNTSNPIKEFKLPLRPRKASSVVNDPNLNLRYMQSGTIVEGKLWIGTELSNVGSIHVVNLETGLLEKTITTDMGHLNSLDYNPDNKTLIIPTSGYIYLYKNPASVQGTSISENDSACTKLQFTDHIGSVCWGAGDNEIYVACGYDGNTSTNVQKITRHVLNTSGGAYVSVSAAQKTYDIVAHNGSDYELGYTSTRQYVQDMEYDGYLYIGYGTDGHNFLVLDLDDTTNEAVVVGNYRFDNGMSGVEPEMVCLNGEKIICGSRIYSQSLGWIRQFNR